MKNFTILISLLLIVACKNAQTTEAQVNKVKDPYASLQENLFNQKVEDTVDGGEMLLGKIKLEALKNDPFKTWFNEGYANHPLDTLAIDSIKPLLSGVKLKVFMGTWCEDSQREIPALYKILQQCAFNFKDNMEVVAMTHDKTTPFLFEKDLNITYVPTLIFYENNIELNRIVEYTQQTLEKDILTILSKKPYTPAYSE